MTAAGCPRARLAAMRGEEAAPCPSGRRALGLDDSPAQPTTPLLLLGGLALGGAALVAVVGAQVVRRGRRGGPSRAAAGLLAFGHLEGVSSHNWINAPRSRTRKLSMTNPCPPRQRFSHPDIQINRGQPFNIEWQVGHPRSHNFFTMVKAEDEPKLASHTEKILFEYINDAPPDALKYESEYWNKFHVGYNKPSNGAGGGALSDKNFEDQGRTKVADDDEVAPRRPWAFECPYGTVATPDPATNKTEKPNCGQCATRGRRGTSTAPRWRSGGASREPPPPPPGAQRPPSPPAIQVPGDRHREGRARRVPQREVPVDPSGVEVHQPAQPLAGAVGYRAPRLPHPHRRRRQAHRPLGVARLPRLHRRRRPSGQLAGGGHVGGDLRVQGLRRSRVDSDRPRASAQGRVLASRATANCAKCGATTTVSRRTSSRRASSSRPRAKPSTTTIVADDGGQLHHRRTSDGRAIRAPALQGHAA